MKAPLTWALLLANVLCFAAEQALGDGLLSALLLWPPGAGFRPWQPLTGAFMHASLGHLATNMFGLWMFGRPVESQLGTPRFALLYAAAIASSAATQLLVAAALPDKAPTLGASGALFGVLAAYAMLFPDRWVVLLFPPIPMKAWVFVGIYAGFELWLGVAGLEPGVAHFAHLGGLVGGVLLMRHWRPRRGRPEAGESGPRAT
jgi:membrane associated rhomboid family serine protease